MTHRIHAFWDWFVRNLRMLEEAASGSDEPGRELMQQLRRIHRGITFELGFMPELGFHFIISADGRRELFTTVHKIVDAAPRVDGWTFTALRPRRGLPFRIGVGPYEIDTESVWFSADKEADRINIRLFFPKLAGDVMIYAVAFLLLDVALGEYDTETKIGTIECLSVPDDPEEAGLLPFQELPGFVDALGVGVM